MPHVDVTVRIETTSCAMCGVVFGLPAAQLEAKRANGKDFYCPNGHALHFNSEIERLRKQLVETRENLESCLADKIELGSEIAKLTKKKRRR